MNTSASERVHLAAPCCYKSEAATPKSANPCAREREAERVGGGGGDKCAALCEKRQEAAQHVRIQMQASPSLRRQ